MGDVIGDINARRGRIDAMEDLNGGAKLIKAFAPLANLFGYTSDLRSMSQRSRRQLDGALRLRGSPTQRGERNHREAQHEIVRFHTKVLWKTGTFAIATFRSIKRKP